MFFFPIFIILIRGHFISGWNLISTPENVYELATADSSTYRNYDNKTEAEFSAAENRKALHRTVSWLQKSFQILGSKFEFYSGLRYSQPKIITIVFCYRSNHNNSKKVGSGTTTGTYFRGKFSRYPNRPVSDWLSSTRLWFLIMGNQFHYLQQQG